MSPHTTAAAIPSPARSWMSLTLAFMLVLSTFFTSILASSASAQDANTGLASVVPADTVIYMGLNLDQDSEQWTQTQTLLERAGLSDLAESETGASTEDLATAAEAEGISGYAAMVFTDADAMVDFSATSDMTSTALDTTMDPAAGQTPTVPTGFALVLQPNDPAAISAQFETMAKDEAEVANAELQTVDYNGVTITYWEPAADSTEIGTATAEVDGTVILATRVSDVEPIIDTVQGEGESLADTDGFKQVSEALPTDHISFGYMNLDIMVDAMLASPEFDDVQTMTDMEASRGYVGWLVYASADGFHFDTATILKDPSQLEGLTGFSPSMAEKLPADIMLFGTSNNIADSGIIEYIETMIQTSMGQWDTAQPVVVDGTPSVETPVTSTAATPTTDEIWSMFEQELGFNPNTELLALLDGEWAVAAGVYGLETGVPNLGFLFVSESSDPATLEETTSVLTNIANSASEDGTYTVGSRAVGENEVTTITIDESQTGGMPVVIEFGVVNDSMVIGTPDMVDAYANGTSTPLSEDPNFISTFEKLPSENVISVNYVNIEGQVMPLLDMLVTTMSASTSTLDNHASCGEYATQQEAQDAYDADPSGLWELDQDFDGTSCEDFFAEATAVASPVSVSQQVNIPSAGSVTWIDGDIIRTNSILVIGD